MSAGGTLVLLYHRVTRLERDPHGLAVHPDRFAQHCEILQRRFRTVALSDWNRSGRHVAITFDDGYVIIALEARSILAAAGLPATFFITVGPLGEREEAWWDRLEQILLGADTAATAIDIEIAGRPLWADIRSPLARERAHLALFWRMRSPRLADIESALSALAKQLGTRSIDSPDAPLDERRGAPRVVSERRDRHRRAHDHSPFSAHARRRRPVAGNRGQPAHARGIARPAHKPVLLSLWWSGRTERGHHGIGQESGLYGGMYSDRRYRASGLRSAADSPNVVGDWDAESIRALARSLAKRAVGRGFL